MTLTRSGPPTSAATAPRRTWASHADRTIAWFRSNERMPREHVGENAERDAGKWLGIQRRSTLTFPQARLLDLCIPGWSDGPLNAAWQQHLTDIVQFRADCGRLPVEDTADDAERALGKWLQKQVMAAKTETVSVIRLAQLDAHLPGWKNRVAQNAWFEIAEQVKVFIAETGRRPSRKAKDDAERTLGAWLRNQRVRLRVDDPQHSDRIALLDAIAPGWR